MPLNPYEETLLQDEDRNPYRETLRQQQRQSETALRLATKQAAEQSPEREAEILSLSERTGLPSSVIDRNFDTIKKRAQIADTPYSQMLRDTPKLAEWIADPDNAALAQDDLPQLGMLEWLLTQGRDYLGSAAAGPTGFVGGALSGLGTLNDVLARAMGSVLPAPVRRALETPVLPWWGNPSEILRQPGGTFKEAAGTMRAPEGRRGISHDIVEAVGQIIGQVGVAVVGGSAASFASLLAQGADIQAEQIRSEPRRMSQEAARAFGDVHIGEAELRDVAPYLPPDSEITAKEDLAILAGAVATAATERLGLDVLMRRVPEAIRNRAIRGLTGVLIGAASEATQEVSEASLQDIARKILTNPEAEIGTGTAYEALIAGSAGGIAQAIILSAAGARRRNQARTNERFIQALGEGVTNSKTFQRLPPKLQELVAIATKDGPLDTVYVPAESWQTFWQDQNLDPAQKAEDLGISREDYAQSVATGEDLAIPTAAYAATIAPTEANAFFAKELRLAPEEMTARETEAFETALAEEPAPEILAPEDQLRGAARIRDDITGQLLGQGFNRDTIDAYAALVESTFRTMGERAGVDPFALYEPYRLKIVRPVPEILRSLPDTDVALDTLIDRLRAGKRPSQQEMFGTSLLDFLKSKGGVQDEGGDLASREADKELKPFQKKLIREEGLPLDKAREAAAEAGYLPEQSTIADFLDAIDKELQGTPVYAQPQQNAQAIEQAMILEQLQGYLKARDVDLRSATNAEIRQLLQEASQQPEIDPQTGTVLEQEAMPGNFKEWFAGSKVVDDNGDPLIVYHGTSEDFDGFDLQKPTGYVMQSMKGVMWFTSSSQVASSYGPKRKDVYLQIRNPLVVDFKVEVMKSGTNSWSIHKDYGEAGGEWFGGDYETRGEAEIALKRAREQGTANISQGAMYRLTMRAKEQGRDGVIFRNIDDAYHDEAGLSDVYAVFSADQIRGVDNSASLRDRSGRTELRQTTELDLEKRGAIRFGPNRQFTIELLEKADLSTFLHESGHFYLEVFSDLVEDLQTRPGELNPTQQRMVEDYSTLLAWLGVESRSQIGKDQHEQWARGFEAYLREGKTPNPELRSVFARFRAWLVAIYRSLSQLRVNLTPEVRGVMDRLVATDEQITQAEQEAGIFALIEDQGMAERLGVSPEQLKLYRDKVQKAGDARRDALQNEFMDEYQRTAKAWWQQRRKEVRADVAAEVHQQKQYIALAVLRKGTLPDGSPLPEGVEPFKLDAAWLHARYGKVSESGITKRLFELNVYRKENGISPDTAAELLGYSSGDELVQALVNARPMDALIDAETDSRMKDQYGDMLTDGTAAEKAKDAVMTEGRAEVILEEIKALARAQRQAAPLLREGQRQERQAQRETQARGIETFQRFVPKLSVIRSWAEQRVREAKVRDVRPGTYWAAARRASQSATQAALEQRFDEALTWKQRELLNVEMYRAALDAQKEIESIRQLMRSFDEKKKRERIGKAGDDYLDQIDALRERFDFARLTNKQIERRKQLAAWAADRQAQNLPVDIPASLLDESRRMSYRDATVEELAGLRDAVEHIAHLARLKNKLLKAKDKRDLESAAAAVSGSIEGNSKGRRPVILEDEAPGERHRRGLAGFFAWQRKLASYVRQMDGGQDGGAVWEYVMRPINEAADAETVMKEAATLRYMDILKIYSRPELAALSRKDYIPAVNTSLSKEARIMLALYWGNAEGRQRVMGGYKWNEQQIAGVLDTLDEKDWSFVRGIWKEVNSYWSDIEAKQKRVYGVAPEKVEALAYPTRFGEVPGGYVPLKYAVSDPQTQAQSAAEISEQMMKGAFSRATTRRGFTKERADTVNRKPRLSLNTIWEHTSEVIHDLTHHEMLIDVNRLLGSKPVQRAILDHYGDIVYRNIQDAVRDIAAGHVPVQQQGERALEWLRQGTSIARMGWNTMTALVQPLGLTVSFGRVGPGWVGRGIARWLGDAARMESSVTWVHEQSPFMRLRHKTLMREINEVRNKVSPRGSLVAAAIGRLPGGQIGAQAGLAIGDTYGTIEDSYFWLISRAQMIADVPTWLGQYEKSRAAGESEARAIALADQAVIDSQGSGHIKDLAKTQRGTPALKLFTQFMSYFSVVYNQGAEAVARTRFRDPASMAKLAVSLLTLYTLPMLLETAVRDAMRGGDDDEALMKRLAQEQLSYLLNTVVFGRELTGAVEGFQYKGQAGAGFFAEASGLVLQVRQGEVDEAAWKAFIHTAGIVFHLPATQVQRMVDAFIALNEDGGASALQTLLAGKPKN